MTASSRIRARGGMGAPAVRRLLAAIITAQVAYSVLAAPAYALPPTHHPKPETPAVAAALAHIAVKPSAPSGGLGHSDMPHRHAWRVGPSEADPGVERATADGGSTGAAIVPGSAPGPDRTSAPAITVGMRSVDRYASSASRTRGQPARA